MNIDVTNTQSGGVEPISNPDDYKVNVKVPQEPSVQEQAPAVQPTTPEIPVAVTQPEVKEATPPTSTEPEKPISPIINTAGPREEDDVRPFPIPTPWDEADVDAVDFSAFDDGVEGDLEPLTFDKPQETPEEDFSAFGEMDLTPESEKPDTEPVGLTTPPIDAPIQPNKGIEVGVTEFPNGQWTGQLKDGVPHDRGKFTAKDGTVIESTFIDGKPVGAAVVQYPDGTKYTGNLKNGVPDGFGTLVTKKGEKLTGVFQDGNLKVKTPPKNTPSGTKPVAPKKEKPFESVKVEEPKKVKLSKDEDAGYKTWKGLNDIDGEVINGELSKGNLNLDEDKEWRKNAAKSLLTDLNAILPTDKAKLIKSGKVDLTPKEKKDIEKIIKRHYGSVLGADGMGGDDNLMSKPSEYVVDRVWRAAKELHTTYDELNKTSKQTTLGDEIKGSITADANKLKKLYREKSKGGTLDDNGLSDGKEYFNRLADAVDFISTPKYAQFVKNEITTGDKALDKDKLNYQLRRVYNQWVQDNDINIESPADEASAWWTFNKEIGAPIVRLHDKIVRQVTEESNKKTPAYGYTARQKEIDKSNEVVGKKQAEVINKVSNQVLPKHMIAAQEFDAKIKEEYESKVKLLEADMTKTYQAAVQEITNADPNLKYVIDRYQGLIRSTDDLEERKRLSKSMAEELSSNEQIQKLNAEFDKESKIKQRQLNNMIEKKTIDFYTKTKDQAKKEISKNLTTELRGVYKQTGYMAQFNAFNKAEKVFSSPKFKQADTKTQKGLIEQGWNTHVKDITNYYKQKEIRLPKDENERKNKHFTEWTGKTRPKTSDDMATYKHLISSAAHNKFRVFATEDLLSANEPNNFQYKAMLSDRLAYVNAHIEQIERNGEKGSEDYYKFHQAKRQIEKGLAIDENDENSLKSFMNGFADSDIPFISSMISIVENGNLAKAAENYERGDLRHSDLALLTTKTIQDQLQQLNPESTAKIVGRGIGTSLSFMTEIAMTGGFYGAGSKLGFKATQEAGEAAAKIAMKTQGLATKIGAESVATTLMNPNYISKMSKVMQLAQRGTGLLTGATVQSLATGRAEANIQQRETEHVAPQFMLAHAGGYDDIIAEVEKGDEGSFEATSKAIATSALELGIERIGGKLTLGITDEVTKSAVNYMSTNQFWKRTLIAKWARDKGFTSADELLTGINQLRAKGQFSNPFDEYKEELVQGLATDLITGDREVGSSLNLEEQKITALSVLLTGGLLSGANYAGRKMKVKTNDYQTIIEFETKDGEKVYQPINPKTWKGFNSVVASKKFTPDALINFFDNHDVGLDEQQALSEIYASVNPNAKEEIAKIKANIEEFTNEPVNEDDVLDSDIEVEQELDENEQVPEEKTEEELTPEEQDFAATYDEISKLTDIEDDNQDQEGIPSEVGTVEEPIQTEPIQEGGSQEIAPSGMVQETQEVSVKTVEELENERDLAINELAQRFQKVDTDNEEEASLERERRQPEFAKELEKINKQYDTEIESLKQNESATPTNTPTDVDIQPAIEQSTEAPTGEGIQPTVESITSEGAPQIERKTVEPLRTNQNLDKRKMNKIVNSLDEATKKQHFPAELPKDITPKQFSTRLATAVGVAKANELMGTSEQAPKTKTVTKKLSSSEDYKKEKEVKKKEEEQKKIEAIPVLREHENNPFQEELSIGKVKAKQNAWNKKYEAESNKIQEINDNFEDIITQLGDKIKTKDC
jgi:hypothetical protein